MNENKKWEYLRASKNLRFLKDHISFQVWVTPDRTAKERKERKILVDKLKDRTKNGEKNLTIRNNKIVEKLSKNFADKPFHESAQKFWADLFN